MSTPDSLATVANTVAQLPAVQETTQVVINKVVTTGDLIAQMGLMQFGLLFLAVLAVLALFFIGISVRRLADALESGKTMGGGTAKSMAPVSAPAQVPVTTMHPGMSDEKLAVLLAVAAAEVLGKNASVVKFKSADAKEWTWSHQGRVDLHTRRL